MIDRAERARLAREKLEQERARPFTVSVMGQTGAGKTSLINALFGTSYETSAVRPTTQEVKPHIEHGADGGELHFFDMPGIGDMAQEAEGLLATYRDHLLKSDVVLWTIHADSKSLAFDQHALTQILGQEDSLHATLLTKMTFVLTKVDVLIPTPWLFGVTDEDSGLFAPNEVLAGVLRDKEDYFFEGLIKPHSERIVATTYNDSGFRPHRRRDREFTEGDREISHAGPVTAAMAEGYIARHPEHRAIFQRLHDQHRVVSCSARFRYSLTVLMEVIVNKLGPYAVGRFQNFTIGSDLDRLQLSTAKSLCNLSIYDQAQGEYLFSLAHDIMQFGTDSGTGEQ
jgi:predicted GTPase